MSLQQIPLDSSPNQSFQCTLKVDGRNITIAFRLRFSEIAGHWIMTISDAAGKALVSSVPLLPGAGPAANILAQYAYLGIGSAYLVNASSAAHDAPDSTNLGTDFILLWGDTPA